ncbi:hypothetical protein C5B42_00605 [Candidatus Cerribacteria bacterium 'Amazon FNV 2010 28 9']|uniref:Uncharacterized protein n=1 Tax=Candidatus Cerribacteria bacterium 'Amazon FNV 2010 28 9' TaxID=2081795 RepID=A0A317JV59_9BACT|nr:MAG: hypothetical protein C5B42_00605 [Candidatus Cerribacteria bacterium 'Amazon FNV 2010 28 9']
MNEEFKKELETLGVSAAAIAVLEEQELTTADSLADMTYEQYVAMGIKAGSAKKLAAQYHVVVEEPLDADTPVPDDLGKPTVAEAHKDPKIAGALGIDPGLLTLALAGGGGGKIFNMLNVDALLNMYDPEEPDNIGGVLLSERFGEERVIGFKKGTHDVAIAESAKYIKQRRRGYPAKDFIMVDGHRCKLYKVGVLPNDFVAEDPMIPGKALWEDDETSTVYDDVSWAGIPKNVRQLVRIMLKLNLFNPASVADRREVMRLAREGFEALRNAYSKADLRFDELEAAGKLPSLRAQLGSPDFGTGGSDDSDDATFRPSKHGGFNSLGNPHGTRDYDPRDRE